MATRLITIQIKTTVRKQIKRINLWRKLRVPWKSIVKELGLPCTGKTLAEHVRNRGLI